MDNETLLNIMKAELDKDFSGMISRIILYGSRAKNTAREDSDYDVLVILNEPADWEIKDSISDVLYNLNIEYEILISVYVISEYDLTTIKGKQPFIQDAIETGIAV